MGASSSRTLSKAERRLEREGHLNATIEDIWTCREANYAGAYSNALPLRRQKKPEMYEALLEYCRQYENTAEDGNLLGEWLTKTTVATNEEDNIIEIEVEAKDSTKTEGSEAGKPAAKHIVSILGGTNISRAHLLPRDPECSKFWGKTAELLSGADIEDTDHKFREKLVEIITKFRINLMVFDGCNHGAFFDNLTDGILLAIPLLSPDKLAEWRHKEPYDVLIACDSPEAYKLFARFTEYEHVQWATEEDLQLATTVLTESSKILADSLDTHWDEYYSQQGDENEFRVQQLLYLKELLRKEKKVLVPDLKDISSFKLHFGLSGKVKLIKVKLGMVYRGDFATYIPDAWLLAFKSASNWSAFAYPLYRNKRLTLAAACSSGDSVSGMFPALVSFSTSDIEGFRQDAKRRQDKEIVGISLTSDGDSVSTLGEGDTVAG